MSRPPMHFQPHTIWVPPWPAEDAGADASRACERLSPRLHRGSAVPSHNASQQKARASRPWIATRQAQPLSGQGIETVSADVTDSTALARILGSGAFDAVVNCVGWVHHGTILECEPGDWRRTFQLNVDSVYEIVRLVLPAMLAARKGSIVNISSLAGQRGAAKRAAYSATKAAIVGLDEVDLGGLRVFRHPLQRHMPGDDRHAIFGRTDPGNSRSVRDPCALRFAASGGSTGLCRRSGGPCGLSRFRRERLYDRRRVGPGRWRRHVAWRAPTRNDHD